MAKERHDGEKYVWKLGRTGLPAQAPGQRCQIIRNVDGLADMVRKLYPH